MIDSFGPLTRSTLYLYSERFIASIFFQSIKIIQRLLSKVFYMGYTVPPVEVAERRKQGLIHLKKAFPILCTNNKGQEMDVLYIPSPSAQRTHNVVLIALNTTYQTLHPKHYDPFLNNGADVVLWNPTKLTPKSYEQDLIAVIQKLKKLKPHQRIAIKTYCASVDPALSALATLRDKTLSLIVDRGHGDTQRFTESFTAVTKLPLMSQILEEHFTCYGACKATSIPGSILFMAPAPERDELMHIGKGKNLTYEIYEKRLLAGHRNDSFFTLRNSDHWTPWDYLAFNQALSFLRAQGIIFPDYQRVVASAFPSPPPLSLFRRSILPSLIKC